MNKGKCIRLWSTLVASCLVFARPSPAQADQLRDRFFTEAPPGWRWIEDWHSNVECQGSLRLTEVTLRQKELEQQVDLTQAQFSLHCRKKKDNIVVEATYPDAARVFAVNPRYSFALSQNHASATLPKWRVTEITKTSPALVTTELAAGANDRALRQRIATDFDYYLFPAARCGGFGQFRDMINQVGFSFTKVEVSGIQGNDELTVHCQWRFHDP